MMMRKKLAIFTAAVGFLTLCNVVLYSRRLRTEDEVVAAGGLWRMSAASSNGHEKRVLTAALVVASEEWTYGSYNSTSGTTPLPVVAKNSSSEPTQVSITASTSKFVSTEDTPTRKTSPATTAIVTVANPASPSFPFSSHNIATTLANRNYTVNGTIVCVQVPLKRSSNRTRKVTFNTALFMEEQNVTTTTTSTIGNDVLNSMSLALQSSTAVVDGSGNGGIGIDFGANYTGNSSVDVSDVTASIVTTLKIAPDTVAVFVASNASNATGAESPPTTLPVPASATGLSPLNEHPFSLMINVDDLCADAANLTLLILVTTAVSHAAHRQAIRETWGGLSKYHPDVRLAFVMGRPQNEREDEAKIVDEALVHADILQEDFLDTYKNLTLKTVMMLKWAQTHCLNARYVMKTDDDMFINIPNLLKYLRGLRYNRGLLLGRLVRGARPVRSVKSKYYVPISMYRDKMYPDYLSGTGYVMSSDVVAKLYATSRTTPLFFFEDVFITGICAKKARIVRRNHAGFVFYKRPVRGCSYVRAITGHDNSPRDLRKIWNELTRKNLKC